MFNNSVHPKGAVEAVLYAVGGFSYLIVLAILLISLAVVTLPR